MKELDVWADYLGVHYGGYSKAVDSNILDVAKLIVKAREEEDSYFNSDIAVMLGLSKEHVELIQYILCSVNGAFTYGTSPRGLFVDDIKAAKSFIKDFEVHMKENWGEE